jgi:hypothetical protein
VIVTVFVVTIFVVTMDTRAIGRQRQAARAGSVRIISSGAHRNLRPERFSRIRVEENFE